MVFETKFIPLFTGRRHSLNLHYYLAQVDTSRVDHAGDKIDLPSFLNSLLYQPVLGMILSAVNCTLQAKLKTDCTQAAQLVPIDMLQNCHTAASACSKDESYEYVKNHFTELSFKRSMEDLLMRNFEQWSQEMMFKDCFKWRVPRSKTITHPTATLSKNKWIKTRLGGAWSKRWMLITPGLIKIQ